MTNFFYKNRYKFGLILVLTILVVALTGCRFDAAQWYDKPYTTYGNEWVQSFNGGKGLINTIFGAPVILLSYPIAFLCSTIGKICGNSYFWGIFFTTIIVRTLAWPVYSKQNSSSLKMNLMQPEMAKIQRKYANRQDPRSQQMMQKEMMDLYKKYGVNPLGCLTTMFLQFPIFMSMYEVVKRINATSTTVINGAISSTYVGSFALANTKVFGIFEMNTSFFEATDIKDKIFGLVLALAFGGITILQQKLGQKPPKYQKKRPNKNEQQQQGSMKTVMLIMNIMFVVMALSDTTLAIYWLIGGIYQIGQAQLGRYLNEKKYYKLQKQNNS